MNIADAIAGGLVATGVAGAPGPQAKLLVFVAASMAIPLLLVIPVHYWGEARARAGKPPGWDGPGWNLVHLWLAFAWLMLSQLVVAQLVVPGLLERLLSGEPVSAIDFAADENLTGDQILWAMAAEASCLLVILPRAPLRLLWTEKWSPARALAAAWVAFLALKLLSMVMLPWLPDITSSDHPQHELTESLAQLRAQRSFWVVAAVVAVVAPIVEEALFRGVALTALARRIPFLWANVIQAGLFATLHFTNPLWPFFFVMGLTAGWMTRASGGLLPAIALHILNNATAAAVLWYYE